MEKSYLENIKNEMISDILEGSGWITDYYALMSLVTEFNVKEKSDIEFIMIDLLREGLLYNEKSGKKSIHKEKYIQYAFKDEVKNYIENNLQSFLA